MCALFGQARFPALSVPSGGAMHPLCPDCGFNWWPCGVCTLCAQCFLVPPPPPHQACSLQGHSSASGGDLAGNDSGLNTQCVHILSPQLLAYSVAMLQGARAPQRVQMTAVVFEPTPLRTGAWSQRLRPFGRNALGQACAHVCGMRFASRRGFARRRTRPMHNTWSHAGLNRGPYGYWPYAVTS